MLFIDNYRFNEDGNDILLTNLYDVYPSKIKE